MRPHRQPHHLARLPGFFMTVHVIARIDATCMRSRARLKWTSRREACQVATLATHTPMTGDPHPLDTRLGSCQCTARARTHMGVSAHIRTFRPFQLLGCRARPIAYELPLHSRGHASRSSIAIGKHRPPGDDRAPGSPSARHSPIRLTRLRVGQLATALGVTCARHAARTGVAGEWAMVDGPRCLYSVDAFTYLLGGRAEGDRALGCCVTPAPLPSSSGFPIQRDRASVPCLPRCAAAVRSTVIVTTGRPLSRGYGMPHSAHAYADEASSGM